MNRKEFEDLDDDVRVHFEGYRAGLYLRLEVEEMPCEFVKNFEPSYPIIIGSLSKGEDKMGFLQVCVVFIIIVAKVFLWGRCCLCILSD